MHITQSLAKEHSKANTLRIVKFVGNDPEKFADLVKVFLAGPYRITQRAAWPLSICLEKYPLLIQPHLKKILDTSIQPGVHDAVKRNTMRLLQYIKIPRPLHTRITDMALRYLSDPKEPVAVRVFSMTVLSHLALIHPELKNEIEPLIADQLEFESPGFRSRGLKVLKQLKSI